MMTIKEIIQEESPERWETVEQLHPIIVKRIKHSFDLVDLIMDYCVSKEDWGVEELRNRIIELNLKLTGG